MARYSEIENSIWEELQDHSKDAKILYIYAFSNPSVRDSGLYSIGLKTIFLNTGLNIKNFEKALKELEPKLYYDFEQKVMFVSGRLKRRLSGLVNNKNIIKSIQHDLTVFSASFVTSLFTKKYEGALREVGLTLPTLSLPLPLSLSLNTTNTIEPKKTKESKELSGQEVYDYYAKTIKAGAGDDAIKNIDKLLKTGVSKEDLIGRIDAYKKQLIAKPTDFIIQANNFFGEKARYKDFAPIKKVEYAPADPNCKACQGAGKLQTGEGIIIRCACVKEKK